MKISINQMVKMGMLAALAIVLIIPLHFPIIPAANFLIYDPADVPILIGTFMFGPVAGLVITAIVALIQAILLNPDGGWVGLVMHIIATGTLVLVAGSIYKRFHTIKGAIIALAAGAISMQQGIGHIVSIAYISHFKSFQAALHFIYSEQIGKDLARMHKICKAVYYRYIAVFRKILNITLFKGSDHYSIYISGKHICSIVNCFSAPELDIVRAKEERMFVAGFIGSPQMNFINAKIEKRANDMHLTFGKHE